MPEHSPAPTSSRSVYGFVMYLSSYTLLLLYLIWAYIPLPWLDMLGLSYWPQKYWAIAIPVFVCSSIFIFAVFLYPGIICLLTPPLSSLDTITDDFSRQQRCSVPDSIPPIYDLPISDVSRKLYLKSTVRKSY